ncbi:hypothetical protein GF362_06540 [Candidatus Dojkabacteria bacterium]|nr:hypothetical protein [Candidatus Dojkabacteria bacterium]
MEKYKEYSKAEYTEILRLLGYRQDPKTPVIIKSILGEALLEHHLDSSVSYVTNRGEGFLTNDVGGCRISSVPNVRIGFPSTIMPLGFPWPEANVVLLEQPLLRGDSYGEVSAVADKSSKKLIQENCPRCIFQPLCQPKPGRIPKKGSELRFPNRYNAGVQTRFTDPLLPLFSEP